MNINEFINERKDDWTKLEKISSKFKTGTSAGLTRDEIWDLGRLYIAAISDLSILKSSGLAETPGNNVLQYLNGLVVRVHGKIYRPRSSHKKAFFDFFRSGFPGAVREGVNYILISAGIFIGFGILGYVLGLKEHGFVELLVPERIIETVQQGNVWFGNLHAIAPMASSQLMTHNISVTFLAVASGITFGIGTVYLMAFNGLLLGTIAALCSKHNLSTEFWSFVMPHGSLELTAIIIGGAAGLVMGHALMEPGRYRRSDYLAFRSRLTGRLVLGCVPLLVIAGIVEAFFSPSGLPEEIKFLFAMASFSSLMVYFARAGTGKTSPA